MSVENMSKRGRFTCRSRGNPPPRKVAAKTLSKLGVTSSPKLILRNMRVPDFPSSIISH